MLFVLGVGSLVALTNAVITVIWDEFTKIKYWQVAVGVCILGYFSGLIYITPVWVISSNKDGSLIALCLLGGAVDA